MLQIESSAILDSSQSRFAQTSSTLSSTGFPHGVYDPDQFIPVNLSQVGRDFDFVSLEREKTARLWETPETIKPSKAQRAAFPYPFLNRQIVIGSPSTFTFGSRYMGMSKVCFTRLTLFHHITECPLGD